MTTLQEAARKALYALEASIDGDHPYYEDQLTAIESLRTALAQQELPQKERPDFMAGYDAGMVDAKRMAQQVEQQPVCHGCGIPAGDVHMSTCKSGKWPSRVSNGDTAAPAPQAQSILASAVLALNTLWNKSSVKDSAIADRLAVCRVLAESDDDMELTDAQILTLWEETYVQRGWTGIEFARAIERAHGIGAKQ